MGKIITLGFLGLVIVGAAIFGIMYLSYNNTEARLRNQIVNKQTDNKNQLDNTLKQISQTAQVTDEQMKAFKDIIVGYADARGKGGGSVVKMVTEAVPNLDTSSKTFQNLQNIIVAARNSWAANQTALLDFKREHDNCIDVQPSRFFVVTLGGKSKIDVTIVTSTRVDNAFGTGKDDDDKVFKR